MILTASHGGKLQCIVYVNLLNSFMKKTHKSLSYRHIEQFTHCLAHSDKIYIKEKKILLPVRDS